MTYRHRTAKIRVPRYTVGEEIANSVIHGVGVALAVGGLGVLTAFASLHGNAWHIVGCSIFGAALILLYTASTLYHGIPHPRAKAVLRILDHAAIFLLIAGTYTPFVLVSLRAPWRWVVLGAIWALASVGIVFKAVLLRKWAAVSTVLYAALGWVAVLGIKPLLAAIAPGGLVLLLLGGLAYTAGIGFYVWRRLPYHHAIWHVFVLVGSVLHFFAVLFYAIPLAGGP